MDINSVRLERMEASAADGALAVEMLLRSEFLRLCGTLNGHG
jgi:hypothetical protein